MRVTFEPVVVLWSTVSYKCFSCGKSRRKVVRVEQTVNPFNVNNDGSQKTRSEVADAVRAAHALQVLNLKSTGTCTKCKEQTNDQ